MARFGDIVAYQFKADLYCPVCILVMLGETESRAVTLDTERTLNIIASDLRQPSIDRDDERTFDSDEFPKVVLYDNLHDASGEGFYCGSCGCELEN